MLSTAPANLSTKPRPLPFRAAFSLAWQFAAALGSGMLLTLCFAPWNQQWLCWVGLTPLIAAIWFGKPTSRSSGAGDADVVNDKIPARRWQLQLRRAKRGVGTTMLTPWGRGFFLGYAAGLIFFWGAFYWLWEVTPPGWFILAFYMALYFAIWGSFLATVALPADSHSTDVSSSRSPFLSSRWNLWFAFLASSCWVALEWVRGWMFSGFGWNDIGVGLHKSVPLIQIAEWTGVGGVSFMAVFANMIVVATVYRFMLEVRIHKIRPHFDFTLTIAGLLGTFAFGFHRMETIQRENVQPGKTIPLRVAAVQADVPRMSKWTPEDGRRIYSRYERLISTALINRPQLLLLPESATVVSMFGFKEAYDFVRSTAAQAPDTNLLLGTEDVDFGEDGKAQTEYNAAVLLPAGGGDLELYRKIHLVPFGEYIPFRKSFPPFAWLLESQVPGDFGFGTTPGIFRLRSPDIEAAPLICFEDTLGRLVRQPVRQGAQLLVNITNDVWFGRTGQQEQHLAESVFRAVENRRPLVRCANTGATAFVDTTGQVTNILRSPDNGSVFTTGVLWGEVKVPAQPTLTFYTHNGEVFSVACGLAALLATVLHWLRQRRPNKGSQADDGAVPAIVDQKEMEPIP